MDLVRDLGGPRLSWRRLAVLLTHLPLDSAIAREVHGDAALWGPVEQLLAAVIDTLALANWQRAAAGRGKGKQPPKPKPIPRPGVKDTTKRFGRSRLTPDELRRSLSSWDRR